MEQLKLDKIQLFVKIAQAGSFTKAALMMNIPKSRLSRHIQSLEEELGLSLIYRTTRQFRLTEEGKQLYLQAHELIERLKVVVESVEVSYERELQGPIRLTAPEDVGVELIGDICSEFMKLYPKVHLELILTDEVVDLVKDSFDLAIRIGKLQDSTLLTRKIGDINFNLVASQNYFSAHPRPKKIKDIEKHPFLLFTGMNIKNKVFFTHAKKKSSFVPKTHFTSNNFFALRKLALNDKGILLIPDFMSDELIKEGEFVQIFPNAVFQTSTLHLITPPQRKVVPRVKKFSDFIYEKLKTSLSAR